MSKKKFFTPFLLLLLTFSLGACSFTFDLSGNNGQTNPADPSDPTDPEDPKDPTDPTDPEDPNDPTDPTDPEDPKDPEDPTDPKEPNDSMWDTKQDNLRTGKKILDFYNLNDTHGAVEYSSSSNEPGLARLSTYILNQKAKNEDGFVLTSSGDMWQGSADSNITKGALMVDWMNYLGFSAQTIGNHEFDWTTDTILKNLGNSQFPYLASNVVQEKDSKNVEWAKPYTTITRNGVHIGIVGAIGKGQTSSILSSNVVGLRFDEPESYVTKWAKYLRDNGADVVLYLVHDEMSSVTANVADAVDAIFLAHSHATESGTLGSKNVPAIQAGSNGKYVGHINLSYDFSSKKVTYGDYSYMNSGLMDSIADSETEKLWDPYKEEIDTTKNRVVAKYNKTIYKSAVPNIYNQYAYQYFNDVHAKEYTQKIFAVETNNARANIVPDSQGNITYGAVYKALPFDNYLTLMKVKGSNISKLTSYSSGHWFLPGVGDVSGENVTNYVTSSTDYYYILTIDYISTSSYYSTWMDIPATFYEEEALPRNILSRYLQSYPNNIV